MAYEQKTKTTDIDPADFIAGLDHKTRKADSEALLALLKEVTGLEPRMWGPRMIGFGQYHYTYDSGHSGISFMIGFAPRKGNMVLYIMPGYRDLSEPLSRLGKHRLGKACLYINKLADIDMTVLKEIAAEGYAYMVNKYGLSS